MSETLSLYTEDSQAMGTITVSPRSVLRALTIRTTFVHATELKPNTMTWRVCRGRQWSLPINNVFPGILPRADLALLTAKYKLPSSFVGWVSYISRPPTGREQEQRRDEDCPRSTSYLNYCLVSRWYCCAFDATPKRPIHIFGGIFIFHV